MCCFGLAGLATTVAHVWFVPFISAVSVIGSWSIACGSCVSFASRVLILFVRYVFVSTMYVMVALCGLAVSAFPFRADSLLYHVVYPSFSHAFSSFICSSSHMIFYVG